MKRNLVGRWRGGTESDERGASIAAHGLNLIVKQCKLKTRTEAGYGGFPFLVNKALGCVTWVSRHDFASGIHQSDLATAHPLQVAELNSNFAQDSAELLFAFASGIWRGAQFKKYKHCPSRHMDQWNSESSPLSHNDPVRELGVAYATGSAG